MANNNNLVPSLFFFFFLHSGAPVYTALLVTAKVAPVSAHGTCSHVFEERLFTEDAEEADEQVKFQLMMQRAAGEDWVVRFSPVLIYLYGCNHDVSLITSERHT